VYSIDENVGRVLQFVESAGLKDSTLIVYMGDNGFALGEHGFYDKRDAYETSIRVPSSPGHLAVSKRAPS
jgi:N-acetylglucosamine-6-sulfatase